LVIKFAITFQYLPFCSIIYSLLIIFSVNAIGKIKKNRKITAIKNLKKASLYLYSSPVLLSNIYFFSISENF